MNEKSMTMANVVFCPKRTKNVADLELELETYKRNANDELETTYQELEWLHEENCSRVETIHSLESKVVSLQSTVDSFTPWKCKSSSALKDDTSKSESTNVDKAEIKNINGNLKEDSSSCKSSEKQMARFNMLKRINSAPILQRVLKPDIKVESRNFEASLLLRVQELELKLQQRESAIENLECTIMLKDEMLEKLRSEIDADQPSPIS